VNGHLKIEDQKRSCWIIFIKRDASSRRCGPFSRERMEWKMDAHFLLSCRLQQSGASSDMTSHSAAAAAGHPPSVTTKGVKETDGQAGEGLTFIVGGVDAVGGRLVG
jgi:hypothetical protein